MNITFVNNHPSDVDKKLDVDEISDQILAESSSLKNQIRDTKINEQAPSYALLKMRNVKTLTMEIKFHLVSLNLIHQVKMTLSYQMMKLLAMRR